MKPPELSASARLEVPFHDVDAMEVAWHGHYLKYFELARCELLRKFEYDYPQMKASGYMWPIVECQLKYVRSAVYGQQIEVVAVLDEYENRIRIRYEIRDVATGTRLTRGHTVQVAVEMATGELQYVSPQVLLDKLAVAWGKA